MIIKLLSEVFNYIDYIGTFVFAITMKSMIIFTLKNIVFNTFRRL